MGSTNLPYSSAAHYDWQVDDVVVLRVGISKAGSYWSVKKVKGKQNDGKN